jgi:hypothetical protein
VRLWTDDTLPELERRAAFDRGRNHAERSDVLRYELLLRFGGIYAVHRWTKLWAVPEAQREKVERLEAKLGRLERATARAERRRARAEDRLERLVVSRAREAGTTGREARPRPTQPSADGGATR